MGRYIFNSFNSETKPMDVSVLTDVGPCSVDHLELQQVGPRFLQKRSAGRFKAVAKSQNVSPNAGLGALYQGAQAINNILLPQGNANLLSVAQQLILEITLSNGDAVHAATILPAQFLVSQIQVNSNQTLETIQSEHLLIKRLYLANADMELDQRAQLEYFTYAYPGGFSTTTTTIAASGSTKVYLEIPCCITSTEMFLPAVNQQITLMITFPPSCVTSTSASTTVTCTDMRLFMNGFDYEPQVRNRILNEFAKAPVVYGYNFPMIEQLSNITVSSASESNFQINSFSDFLTSSMFFMVRAVNATQQNLYAFDRIATCDLRKDGASWFLSKLNVEEFNSMIMPIIKTSVPNSNTDILALPFSTNIYESLKHNKLRGYIKLTPNINALLQMVSANGNRDLICCIFTQGVVTIQNGNISYAYLNDQRR